MAGQSLDKGLVDSLKRARKAKKEKPFFFALVVKSASAGKLIVSKKKIPTKDIAEAKKEVGGTAVVKGLCYGGAEGDFIFETIKPPAPSWAVLTKKLAKEDAGLAIKPLFTLGRDDDAVEEALDEPEADEAPEDEADEAPKDEAVPDKAAAWQKRVDEVTARVKAAAAAKHPQARDMALGVSQAGAYFRGGKPADADARLKEVEALLGPAAPPGQDPVVARFATLSPGLKAALAAKGPDFSRIQTLAVAVNGLLKNKDYVQAGKVLDELEPLLKPKPSGGADLGAEFKQKLAEYQPAIKDALAANPPTAGDIKKLFAQANALSKGGDVALALEKLTECHTLARAATKAPPPPSEPAALIARYKALAGAIKAALAAQGPDAGRIDTLNTAVNSAFESEDYTASPAAWVDELEELVGAKTAPDPAAEWKAKLAEAQPAIKDALAANPPTAGDIKKLFAQANALSKPGGDMAQALAKLAECHDLARQAVGSSKIPMPPPKPPGEKAAVVKRMNALAAGIKAALAGPNAARVGALVTTANGLLRNNNVVQAGKVLDELEPLLKAAPTGPDPLAEYRTKLADWTPIIKKAIAAKVPASAEVGKLLSQAVASAKPGGDPARALALLTEAHEKAQAVLGEAATDAKKPDGEAPEADAELAAEYTALLKGLKPKFDKVLARLAKTDPPAAAALGDQLSAAADAHGDEDHAKAYDLLTTLDARVTTLLRAAKADAEVRKAAGPENVAFAVSKAEWDKARQAARAELAKFQQAVLSDEETRNDPRFDDEIAPKVNALGSVLDEFNDLDAVIQEAADKPPAEKAPSIRKALDLIAVYRQKVDASPAISAMDSGVYGPANVGGSLTAALATMADRLTKRLNA